MMANRDIQPIKQPKSRKFRLFWLTLGWIMIILSPVVGAVPGPGFILIFPVGLALVLKNSLFAKRQYTKLARTFPEYGNWVNWALRRKRFKTAPPAPDIWGDIKRIFRRDDGNHNHG